MDKRIKLFVMDVDGTMTDGKIYIGESGELFKVFDIKDGYGIHETLRKRQIKTAIITGRESKIVANRAKELEIDFVFQNIKEKIPILYELAEKCACDFTQIAYIGDDLMDLEAMKICGISGCPANAINAVRLQASYICETTGGNGAVREFIEWLEKNKLL